MRRTLLHLLLATLALAGPARAQDETPDGVALSPFPVQLLPAAYRTFGDQSGGVWAVFRGAHAGSALYAQHVLADGSFAAGFGPAARAITHSGTQVNALSATPDGLGGAIIIWFGVNPLDSTSAFVALRCQHLDPEGRNQFPDSGLVVSSIASAAMAVGDGQGGVYVAWEELKGTSNPDIVAQHYGYFGNPLWVPLGSPTGRNVCAIVGLQRLRAIQEDGAGGAYVVWADYRSAGTAPLYCARLVATGVATTPWPTNGLRVTPSTVGIRIVGSACSPGGGLWVAWRDINIANQCMAQHVTSDAGVAWPANGAMVAEVTPLRADFVPASSGDVFVTWGDAEIRSSRLDAGGARVWPEIDGRVLVTPPTTALDARAAPDGAGGQRIAWTFDNSGQGDVHTLRVDGDGMPWPGQPPLGEPFAATPLPEQPVAWLMPETSQSLLTWLSGGILRVRMPTGGLGVAPPPEGGTLALAPPAPHPLRGGPTTLRFSAAPGPARLDLFDAAGRRVWVRTLFSHGGPQTMPFDEAARLAPGVYTLRLAAAGGVATRRLVRVR